MSDRKFIAFRSRGSDGYNFGYTISDPYEKQDVRRWDQILCQTLSYLIFNLCFDRDSVKKLVCSSERPDRNSWIFELILQQEPALGKLLLKRNKLSLLWIAVLSCYQELAELLVRSGADVNELYELQPVSTHRHDIDEKSTLLHALLQMYPSAWNERLIGLLIEHGADINARDSDHETPLHVAARYSRVKVAKMLLEKGANVDAVRVPGMTPLHDAALNSQAQDDLIPLLMRYGADVTARDESGDNVLRYLASAPGEHVDLARVLIEKGVSPREVPDSNQYQTIHVAVLKGKFGLVNLYLDHGANVNAPGFDDESPLYVAAQQCGQPEMLLTLLKRGANIDLRTPSGKTALHGLVEHHSFGRIYKDTAEKLKILLSAGADMFAEDNDNSTPFGLVYQKNVKYLLIFLKTLALRKASLQPSAEFKDETILKERYPQLWDVYQACVEELNRIKSTKFLKSAAFFQLLTECHCQVASLMRHRKFGKKFWRYDFSAFPLYAEDIVKAFEPTELYYHSELELENALAEATSNIFPYLVVRKMAGYTIDCETCQMKKTVQASRG